MGLVNWRAWLNSERGPYCQAIAAYLRRHAVDYFPELEGPLNVRLVSQSDRVNSQLYEYVVSAKNFSRRLMVKVPFPSKVSTQATSERPPAKPDRPRLFAKIKPEFKVDCEFAAMSAVMDCVAQLGDSRFGAVGILDQLHEPPALVMEKVSDPSLRYLLIADRAALRPASALRWGGRQTSVTPTLSNRLVAAMYNSGAWLRNFHRLPDANHTRERNECEADFVRSIHLFTDYLRERIGRTRFFGALDEKLASAAHRILPQRLPLGLCHGDFAPRNILVGPAGRVTVLDTLARWRAPIYEDIGQFLVALNSPGPHNLWMDQAGCALRARYERAFLSGFFGDGPLPLAQIRLFECQVLLERWVSLAHRHWEAGGWKRWIKGCRLALWTPLATRHIPRLLAEAEVETSEAPCPHETVNVANQGS